MSVGCAPELEGGVPRDIRKVVVGGEHRQVVCDTELREQRIDRIDLYATAAALIPEFCRSYVVFPLRNEPGERVESLNDCFSRSRPVKSLQQLLQDQSGGEHRFSLETLIKEIDCGMRYPTVMPHGKRPYARISEDLRR
jgi:hypothetical protein